MFTKASNSLTTISILSQPIPVEMTETLLLFKSPVWVTNSLFSLFISILSKYFEIVGTRSWSPTRIIVEPISLGSRSKW